MGRFARLLVLVAVSVAIIVPQAQAADQGPSERGEKLLLKYINEFRVNQGLAPVVAHQFASREARKHNNWQANHGELSHDNFEARAARIEDEDGGTDADRMCENVASAQGYDNPGPVAKLIFRAWRRTAGKRACMLDGSYTKESAGVGVTLVGDTWYATLINMHDATP